MSHDLKGGAGRRRGCRPGRVVQLRCLECGADHAEATEICARCGAPTGYQSPAAYPPPGQSARRSRPSRLVLITVEVAAALGVVAGLIAGSHHSGSSASSSPSTGQLTIYQLRTGDCLQDPGQTLVNFNEQGPFTVVRCTQRHAAEVFFAGNAWPRSLVLLPEGRHVEARQRGLVVVDELTERAGELSLADAGGAGKEEDSLRPCLGVDLGRAQVGGEDDQRVREVRGPTEPVGETAVVQDLQEFVQDRRMGLLDLVEKQQAERPLADPVGELAAAFVADIAGGRTGEPLGGVRPG